MNPRTIWLASYPRSGNTWFRIVYSTALSADPDRVDLNKLQGGPGPVDVSLVGHHLGTVVSELTPDEIHLLRPLVDEAVDAEGDRVLLRKTHDSLLPGANGRPVISPAATKGAIYLVRDPRAVAASYAKFRDEPIERTVAYMGDEDAGNKGRFNHVPVHMSSWSRHVDSWTTTTEFPVHVVRYEDCRADPVAAFEAAFAFAGLTVERTAIERAVAAADLDRLRGIEEEKGFREAPRPGPSFFGKGDLRPDATTLPQDLERALVERHAATMERWGYR